MLDEAATREQILPMLCHYAERGDNGEKRFETGNDIVYMICLFFVTDYFGDLVVFHDFLDCTIWL